MNRRIIFLTLLAFPLLACSDENQSSDYEDQEYQRQINIFDEQAAKSHEQQVEMDKQLKLANEQADKMETLLERWSKQADRYDAILDKWENQPAPVKN